MNERIVFTPEQVLQIAKLRGVDKGNAGRAAYAAEQVESGVGQIDPDYAKRALRALEQILEEAEAAIATRPTAVQTEVRTSFRKG